MASRRMDGFTRLHGLSLRAGLAIGFVAMIVLALTVGLVSLLIQQHFIRTVDKLLDVDVRIADLSTSSNIAMLKARRAEKDFLLYRRVFGFDEAKSRYATLLRIRLAEIREHMSDIRALSSEPAAIERTLEIERALSLYEAGFLGIVDLYGVLGFVNSGLAGQFRETAHRIESLVSGPGEIRLLADLLALRRHEKDFIARGLDKDAEAFAKGIDRFKTDLLAAHLASERKQELLALADTYARLFEHYVQTDARIDAETAAYVAAVHTVEPMLDELRIVARRSEIATRNDAEEVARLAGWTISAAMLMALLLGVTVAWRVARAITRSVDACLDFANRVAQGDLTRRLTPSGRSEFAAMATALNRMTEALQEREAGLERAQQMAKLSHVITAPDGSFEKWPDTLPQLIGVDEAGMPRSTRALLDILHPDDRARIRAKVIEAGVKRARTDVEYRLRRGDGSWVDIRQVMDPLEGEANTRGQTRWFSTLQDITERKADQRRIERLNRVHAVLSGINGAIVRIRDRTELFRESCRIAVDAGQLSFVWIGLVDGEAMRVVPAAWHGAEHGFLDEIRERLSLREDSPAAQSIVVQAIRAKSAVISNDVRNDPRIRFKSEHETLGFLSVAVFPLLVSGEAAGILVLHAREPGFFDDEETKLLHQLAGDIAFAMDHIGKGEELSRATEGLKRLNRTYAVISGINAVIVRTRDRDDLFRETCRIAAEIGQFSAAWIGIVDRGEMLVRPIAWRGTEEEVRRLQGARLSIAGDAPAERSILAELVGSRQAIFSNDVMSDPRARFKESLAAFGIRSAAFLPLLIGDEVAAVLVLYSQQAEFFDDSEVRLLLELAGDLSFAMEHISNQESLNYLALYDSLTGLANRTLFLERLGQSIHVAEQSEGKLAVVLADIERLRTVNESLGRQAGDALLKQAAGRLARAAQASQIGRIGTDHFAIMLPAVKGKSEVIRGIARLSRRCFDEPFRLDHTEIKVAAKAGIVLFPSDGADAETLLRNAEAALKGAKESGERYVFYSRKLTERVAQKLTLESRLRQALEKDEFVLHYQPKVELEARRIVGAEALIRWQNPELGLVPPGEFIPLMEDSGLIVEVGAWALSKATADHLRWLEQGLAAPRVAVNVSAIQLRRADFFSSVANALKRGATPPGIDLEITESLVMEDIDSNVQKLKAVRALGVSIAIDDFGTGYSSLGYLAKLPVQSLKIDRSFIVAMVDDPDTATLVRTIITLAHSLRLKVVAEGVDSEEQARFLRLLRCDEMQGYLFSRPVPFDDMTALLKEKSREREGVRAH